MKEAREQVRRLQAAVIDGENPAYEKRRKVKDDSNKRQTLEINNLLDLYDQLHLSQLKTGYQAKTFLREFTRDFGNSNITDFTKQDFVGLLNEIMAAGNGTKANRVFTHVKTFFGWAIGQGFLEYSPCMHVKKPF